MKQSANKTEKKYSSDSIHTLKKVFICFLVLITFVFVFNRCQHHRVRVQSADAQWALENLSLAQQAYYAAYSAYSSDYQELSGFGFQKYSNIFYSNIETFNRDGGAKGWAVNVQYKSKEAKVHYYDSTKGGYLDLANY